MPNQYLLLYHSDKKFSEIEWHWFTVTGYDETETNFFIVFSTWGERRIESLKELWNIGVEECGGLLSIL